MAATPVMVELHKLVYIGRNGEDLIYQMPNEKLITLDIGTVTKLGMPIPGEKKTDRTSCSPNSDEDIWSGVRSSRDKLATKKLLEILKSRNFRDKFSAKKIKKKEVWVEIANQLMESGFKFRNKENAWEKVSQKWRNMERTYRVYVSTSKLDGGKEIDFFDDLNELLADKYLTPNLAKREIDNEENIGKQSEEFHEVSDESHLNDDTNTRILSNGVGFLYHAENGIEYTEDEYSRPGTSDKEMVVPDIQITEPDPVLRTLLEMRAEERKFWEEDRKERLQFQKDLLNFHQDLITLLNQQHKEKMEATYALITAINHGNKKMIRKKI